MSTTRVYLPTTAGRIRSALDHGELGPPPLHGHAVTDALRAEVGDADEEELEYVAMTAASLDAVRLLLPGDPPLRMVAAVEVSSVASGDDEPGAVVLVHPVPVRRLAALHIDSDAAAEDVAAARAVAAGDAAEEEALRRCLRHDLEWYAPSEVAALLDRWPITG